MQRIHDKGDTKQKMLAAEIIAHVTTIKTEIDDLRNKIKSKESIQPELESNTTDSKAKVNPTSYVDSPSTKSIKSEKEIPDGPWIDYPEWQTNQGAHKYMVDVVGIVAAFKNPNLAKMVRSYENNNQGLTEFLSKHGLCIINSLF